MRFQKQEMLSKERTNVNIATIKRRTEGNWKNVIDNGSHTSEKKLSWNRMENMDITLKSEKEIDGQKRD
jgi:hypothetical protein